MESCILYDAHGVQGKILSNYPKYVIQENGEIFSLYKKVHLVGTTNTSSVTYDHMTLTTTVDGKKKVKSVAVHILVATAYCPITTPDCTMVDHIDGNKRNNAASNLEWVTPAENARRAHKMKRNTGSDRAVEQYSKEWKFIAKFSSLSQAQRATGVDSRGISSVVTGKRQTAGGFRWTYTPDELDTMKKDRDENELPRDGEEWKTYEELPGYELSNYGRAYSIVKDIYIKPCILKGYYVINYKKGGRQKSYSVNRLVALLFLEVPDNWKELVVNHIDGNKLNNHVSNLEWVTKKRNTQLAFETGLSKHVRPCVQYSLDGKLIAKYKSIAAASLATGIGNSNINSVCRGKRQTMGGFVWRFEADPFERNGKKVYKNHSSYDKPCIQYKKTSNGKLIEIARYKSAAEASKKTGVHQSSIGMCCTSKYHSAGGFVWKYSQ
jgi:HNH endonuclease/NUMOD1 domain